MDDPIVAHPEQPTDLTDEAEQDPAVLQWLHRVTTPSPRSMRRWPKSMTGRLIQRGLSLGARPIMHAAQIFIGNASEAWACERLDANNWPTRPLRVGVTETMLRHTLERTSGQCVLEWVAASPSRTSAHLCKSLTLDAVLRMDAKGGLLLVMPETRQRSAAWHDWSADRPVTFATLFPGRVDCAELILPSDAARPGNAWFLRRLVEAAATLARHPSRLSAHDRLNGRTPRVDTLHAFELHPSGDATRDAQRLVIHALWNGMKEGAATRLPGSIAAARLVSAFAVGADDDLPETTRVDMASSCVLLVPDEPEVHLRLAAARLASHAHASAMDSLLTGERLLRDHSMKGGTNQVPFLQAELEAGGGRAISLGRVAAGIAMVCASLESSHIPFFRDDVLDDVCHSDWLIPKDEDRNLIIDIFRAILAQRAATDANRMAA